MHHLLSRTVIIQDNHLLLAYDPRREPKHYYELNVPFYYLPGGYIEFNESAEAAVLREIYEETGFDSYIHGILFRLFQWLVGHKCNLDLS